MNNVDKIKKTIEEIRFKALVIDQNKKQLLELVDELEDMLKEYNNISFFSEDI